MPVLSNRLLFLLSLGFTSADLLGGRYPPPQDLTSEDSLVAQAWQNLTDLFDGHLNGNSSEPLLTGVEALTFSFGAFSLHDTEAASALQYHHTSPEIRNSPVGVNEVDADSVYRFASVSKLFTVYAGMVLLSEEEWHRPLSQIFPHHNSSSHGNEDDLTRYSQWDEVTPLALAAQLGGVAGNAAPFALADLYLQLALAATPEAATDPITLGLPPVNNESPSLSPFCEANCTGNQYLRSVETAYPMYEPYISPAYSNNGFIILGQAIAAITGKSFNDVYNDAIFEPLGMTSSNSTDPFDLEDRAVITGADRINFFAGSGVGAASGGLFSTLNDLAKFSTSILNSTLLPAEKTRRWLKPMAHTADLSFSHGAGFEIFRYVHPEGSPGAGAVTDLYAKTGSAGNNGGVVVLIPDYDAGFNCIIASNSTSRGALQDLVFDAITREILPALEAQAAREAEAKFAGTYLPTDQTLNTTLTLAVNSSVGSLMPSEWVSNGTNMLNVAPSLTLYQGSGGLRFWPTTHDVENGRYAFRIRPVANETENEAAIATGPFTRLSVANFDWVIASQTTYGNIPHNLAIFELDEAGEATGLTLPAFNVTLERQME